LQALLGNPFTIMNGAEKLDQKLNLNCVSWWRRIFLISGKMMVYTDDSKHTGQFEAPFAQCDAQVLKTKDLNRLIQLLNVYDK